MNCATTSLNEMISLRLSLFCLIFVVGVYTQEQSGATCGSFKRCNSCIQQPECIWCLNPEIGSSQNSSAALSHCLHKDSKRIVCAPTNTVSPKMKVQILRDIPLERQTGKVQLKPQRVQVHMRLGESYDLNFQYSQAQNYPVDLYYLIDDSYTMKVHKAKLSDLGNKLAQTMKNITNDFKIGFGSFIDKRVQPYVHPLLLDNPCGVESEKCIGPYLFKNHMPLGTDFERFSREVREAPLSANLDAPEGTLDALMQAIVCKKEIGWRSHARHLIVLSTDADFHTAGDGMLGGIVESNDATCHLKNNIYYGLDTDYPSVSQLDYIAKENNVNIIFAVVPGQQRIENLYKTLSENIGNSKAGVLSSDSGNVIDLVKDNYNKILSSVSMEVNATQNVQVEIKAHCSNSTPNGCLDLHPGEIVNFTATIKPLKCDNGLKETFSTISIKPNGINERLIVEIRTFCSCDCQSPTHSSFEANSDKCYNGADFECGVCACTEGYHGKYCECSSSKSEISNQTDLCRAKPGDEICSGLGECVCGECVCRRNPNSGERYWGAFCGCDDYNCLRENGKLCGGRGNCSCGVCHCEPGWLGKICECPNNNITCMKPGSLDVCSGKGICSCGVCECSGQYVGTFCEDCPTCKDRCSEIKNCVECTLFHTGPLRHDCFVNCSHFDIQTTKYAIVADREEDKLCRGLSENKCDFFYKYTYDSANKLIITARDTQICEKDPIVWVFLIIGCILLVGLLSLVIWKITIFIHDKRDYSRFLKEQKESKWHSSGNPLYKKAVTSFENPYFKT